MIPRSGIVHATVSSLMSWGRSPETESRVDMRTLVALAIAAFIASPAVAANVTNADGDAHVLIVTEDGEQSEVGLNPGQTVDICPNGCFVNMPNGDREALTGSESIEISGGKAVFK